MGELFGEWFQKATGQTPHAYQASLAMSETLPRVWKLPTGSGKTASAVLTWLWRREKGTKNQKETTGKRLVYCLPMRVLVEQTESVIKQWLKNLDLEDRISVHLLMGGEDAGNWALYPEKPAILLGTQDMLLSRALNRGYGASRSRWPMDFGLVNNDALWIMDEVQLMGPSLDTSAQLAGFRKSFSPLPNETVWMSATVESEWVETVDHPGPISTFELEHTQFSPDSALGRVFYAKKFLNKILVPCEAKTLSQKILEEHQKTFTANNGSLTLVVVNTVKRARDIYNFLKKNLKKESSPPEIILLHSRFRPIDRKEIVSRLLSPLPSLGRIVISTQVIEAGVDISASLLFTELAPWPSLVQRMGRLNRKGELPSATLFCVDLTEKEAKPYEWEDLQEARKILGSIETSTGEVGIDQLPKVVLKRNSGPAFRRRDLLELFDTTPDLAGMDIDVSPFIREGEEKDVLVYWRNVDDNESNPGADIPPPMRGELCPVPFYEFEKLRGKAAGEEDAASRPDQSIRVWIKDFLTGKWNRLGPKSQIYPGQTWLIACNSGNYHPETGWDESVRDRVEPLSTFSEAQESSTDDDPFSQTQGYWLSLAEHTDHVVDELDRILKSLSMAPDYQEALKLAARFHDLGKAHHGFQGRFVPDELSKFREAHSNQLAAKAPRSHWLPPKEWPRRLFRHELISALAVLQKGKGDLAAYLIAAHHGKVRLSIRSLPNESTAPGGALFARGVWDGDWIPDTEEPSPIDLGGGVKVNRFRIDLSVMRLGLTHEGAPSWADRMTRLRDQHGCFFLAFLETILRAADQRASQLESQQSPSAGVHS